MIEKARTRPLAIPKQELKTQLHAEDVFEKTAPTKTPEALEPLLTPEIEKVFKTPLLTGSGRKVQDSVRDLLLKVRECSITPKELKIQLKEAKQQTIELSGKHLGEHFEKDRQTYENLGRMLNDMPKLQKYQESLKTWLDADSDALIGAGQQRTLRLPDWFQVQELEQKTLKAAQASGIFQDFTQEELKEFEKTKNFTAEIEEHHRIAQQEVKRLTRVLVQDI